MPDKTGHRKWIILAAIVVSAAVPLFFLDYTEPDLKRWIAMFLGKTGAMAGTALLMWQFVLGFRFLSSKLIPDLRWGFVLHKTVGITGLALVVLHAVFITLSYMWAGRPSPWLLDPGSFFSWMVLAGILGFAILAIVVLTSTLFRTRIGRRRWYGIHLSTYAIPLLVFLHSFSIGGVLADTALKYYWMALVAAFGVIVAIRIAHALGYLQDKKSRDS